MPLVGEQEAAFGHSDEAHFAWQVGHPYVAARERELVRAAFEPLGERVLDVGCGQGATLLHLGAPASAVGLDASAAFIAFAREHVPGPEFVVGDAEALPFEGGRFDQLIVRDLVHHLERPELFVREAERLLGRGGRLDLLEPCRYNPLIALHALAVPAERGELRSTATYLRRQFEPCFELEALCHHQAMPLHRVVFHPRLGRPLLGERPRVRDAVAAAERAASWLLPRWSWSYLHLRFRRR
jgi:SAM-dependent methyltransferase